MDFVKTHYTADRIVIAGAGAVDHDQLCKLTSELFADLPKTAPEGCLVDNGGKPHFIGSDVRMREDDMDEAHFLFGFEALPWTHQDSLTLSVMTSLLGTYQQGANNAADSAGRLTRAVAEEGIATSVTPFTAPYKDTGLFGVHCVCPQKNLKEVAWHAQEEVTRMCYEVDEDDVGRAINQVKSNLAFTLDGSQAIFEDIGRQILTLGRRATLKETFDRLDAVTPEEVKRVSQGMLNDRDLVVSAIGPINDLPDYNKFRRRTYWLRY